MNYQNLQRILGKAWLRRHTSHPYNQWSVKPEDSKERLFLSRLDNYVEKATPLHTKRTRSKLRDYQGFVDTYYELEIGCFLKDNGFHVDFDRTLCDERGTRITPDIFVEKDNVIVEVKTLHRSNEAEKGLKSGKIFEFNEAERIKDDIFSELQKYWNKRIKYPLIVIVCPDFIEPPLVTADDFETVLSYRIDRWVFKGKLRRTPDIEYRGLYYEDEGQHARILSGVGLWGGTGILFYENPNVNKESRIPKSRFLDFLKRP